MKSINQENYKILLLKWLNDLRDHDGSFTSNLENPEEEAYDIVDKASLEVCESYFFRMKGRESRLVEKIEAALQRIEDGSFGICTVCGKEIPEERLKARPIAFRCIDCKEKSEREE